MWIFIIYYGWNDNAIVYDTIEQGIWGVRNEAKNQSDYSHGMLESIELWNKYLKKLHNGVSNNEQSVVLEIYI